MRRREVAGDTAGEVNRDEGVGSPDTKGFKQENDIVKCMRHA